MLNYNNVINIIINSTVNLADIIPSIPDDPPEDCVICYEVKDRYIQYECRHTMCEQCFAEFNDPRCHICRREYRQVFHVHRP